MLDGKALPSQPQLALDFYKKATTIEVVNSHHGGTAFDNIAEANLKPILKAYVEKVRDTNLPLQSPRQREISYKVN